MTCYSYFSTLLGVTIYVHRWFNHATRCACNTRYLYTAARKTID